jgi:hypothetical protein
VAQRYDVSTETGTNPETSVVETPAGTTADAEDDEATDFERFENLAQKLVAVPKSEIDEQREKAKAS